ESSQIANQIQALPSINPVSYSLPLVASASQPAFSKDDIQKAIQEALAQQKTEYQSLLEKQKADFQSQMTQQAVAQKAQAQAPQTVEPVRQPRGPPSSLQTEEGMGNYRLSQFLNNLGIFSTEDLERNYPIKPFQRPRSQQNQSMRMDRIESKVDEIGQMTSQFGRMMLDNQSKKPVAKSNSTYRYFPPLIPSQFQYASPDSDDNEDEEGGYNEEENKWHAPSQSEKKT
ncbi:23944_t:CDS:1, partial [Gigaspora rosea]